MSNGRDDEKRREKIREDRDKPTRDRGNRSEWGDRKINEEIGQGDRPPTPKPDTDD